MNEPRSPLHELLQGNKKHAPVAQRVAPEEPLEIQDERFFGRLRGVQDTSKAVEVRRQRGSWPALRYVYLKCTEWLHAGHFKMVFITGETVEVKGRNLRTLYDHLLTEKLAYIREAADGEKVPEHELFVDEIVYQAAKEREQVEDADLAP